MPTNADFVAYQPLNARLESFGTAFLQNKRPQGRTQLFKWPHRDPSPEDLAATGFFYAPKKGSTDAVKCFMCGVELEGWEPTDDPAADHLTLSPGCAWAHLSSNLGLAWAKEHHTDTLSGTPYDPHSEDNLRTRLYTFTNWPHGDKLGSKLTPEALAHAGFHYSPLTSSDDRVECGLCGKAIDSWDRTEDPVALHERISSDCLFFSSFPLDDSRFDLTNVTNMTADADVSSVQYDVSSKIDISTVNESLSENTDSAQILDINMAVPAKNIPKNKSSDTSNSIMIDPTPEIIQETSFESVVELSGELVNVTPRRTPRSTSKKTPTTKSDLSHMTTDMEETPRASTKEQTVAQEPEVSKEQQSITGALQDLDANITPAHMLIRQSLDYDDKSYQKLLKDLSGSESLDSELFNSKVLHMNMENAAQELKQALSGDHSTNSLHLSGRTSDFLNASLLQHRAVDDVSPKKDTTVETSNSSEEESQSEIDSTTCVSQKSLIEDPETPEQSVESEHDDVEERPQSRSMLGMLLGIASPQKFFSHVDPATASTINPTDTQVRNEQDDYADSSPYVIESQKDDTGAADGLGNTHNELTREEGHTEDHELLASIKASGQAVQESVQTLNEERPVQNESGMESTTAHTTTEPTVTRHIIPQIPSESTSQMSNSTSEFHTAMEVEQDSRIIDLLSNSSTSRFSSSHFGMSTPAMASRASGTPVLSFPNTSSIDPAPSPIPRAAPFTANKPQAPVLGLNVADISLPSHTSVDRPDDSPELDNSLSSLESKSSSRSSLASPPKPVNLALESRLDFVKELGGSLSENSKTYLLNRDDLPVTRWYELVADEVEAECTRTTEVMIAKLEQQRRLVLDALSQME